ncbi:hypothetical protein HPHPP62_1075 [Helicobacter pylori Hp P-62]|nr:hypothetical protein HPHPP62_1075 [Helicobacter pylori Hp P-62]
MALKATQLAHSLMIDFLQPSIFIRLKNMKQNKPPYKNASNL